MSATIVIRPTGPTYALSVANTLHASVAILPTGNDQINFCAFTNTGSTDICVNIAPIPSTGIPTNPTLAFPVDGTPTVPNSFLIPHGMTGASVLAVPPNGFSLSAIGSAAGPSIMYVTPVGDQS
jgi:hypothetical protein